jgi:hypothetical protein
MRKESNRKRIMTDSRKIFIILVDKVNIKKWFKVVDEVAEDNR